ncbi:NAD kinase 2, chloroplastic [Linum perenne]
MVACLCFCCHVSAAGITLLSSPAITGCFLPPSPHSHTQPMLLCLGSSPHFQRKLQRRKFKLLVTAEFPDSPSFTLGFDEALKHYQSYDQSQSPWIGPIPGDIAEVEAYCRIFRAAEQLHSGMMNRLCNPATGECNLPYDFLPEEKPLLEDKIVLVLGAMVSLLNKGREDVLSGRSSIMKSFSRSDVSTMEDDVLPPLAIFRSEMKRCCESLHVALENYLTSNDDQGLEVWRRLQRLKNVCYDSGFPRSDEYPCHTLLANWNAVYSSSSSKDEIEAGSTHPEFWTGGQVSEEALNWLLEKGFRTIVDLRAETINDKFYKAAINGALLSGKVEVVQIPVEIGTAPSVEQVEMFASLVSDLGKKPIYLHSKEGVQRTSALVSRWRQYMTRKSSKFTFLSGMMVHDTVEINKIHTVSSSEQENLLYQENGSQRQALHEHYTSNGLSHGEVGSSVTDGKDQSISGARQGLDSVHTSSETIDNEVGSLLDASWVIDPLKAQLPPCNVFSKTEMSGFMKTKKVLPSAFSMHQPTKVNKLSILGEGEVSKQTSGAPELMERTNGSSTNRSSSLGSQRSFVGGKHLNGNGHLSLGDDENAFNAHEQHPILQNGVSTSVNKSLSDHVRCNYAKHDMESNDIGSASFSDDELCSLEGDMCASTTGVVRLQSRKKAEMFLVRTDGFSCEREKVTESSLAFTHPSTQQQMLMWKSPPKTVLLLKKLGQELMEEAKEVASFLYHQEKMNVLVEPDVHDIFARMPGFGFIQTFYRQDNSNLHERIDFVACLGGDGVILHASNLFREAVPPVVSFNLGSLGFLTSHNFEDFRKDLRQLIHVNSTVGVYITLRMRLRCEIFRNGEAVPGKVFDVLNEIVVERGSNPYLSKIECYEHDCLITKVQGDGVIVATPTGSTAYSTAAGGSMVHPNVPCMLFTPICPHSLSFRPVVLPDSARLELKIPEDARSNAWVSFDGKRRQQLSRGDSVKISMSQHPLPTVNKNDQTGDWFHSLIRCLNWNERQDQKAL